MTDEPRPSPDARSAIRTLFHPRSVAVVGASRSPGSRSSRLIANLQRQFRGPVYPVNPHAEQIEDLRAYRTVAEIPEVPDVAAVMVGASALLGALAECAEAGITSAICFASIPTDPVPLHQGIRELALRSGMRVVGPNCLGLFAVNSGVALTYTVVEAAQAGDPPGDTAILGQSGGVLHAMWAHGAELGVRHSHFISTGNEADLTFEDFLGYLIHDDHVRTMSCYVEGIRNPQLLAGLASDATRESKTIVALKVGHSPESQRAALSHTGALVGSMRHADAFLDRIGVLRVESMSDAGAVASILRAPSPGCSGVGVLTTTGGMSAGLADLCSQHGVALPSLGGSAKRTIYDLLMPSGIMNPEVDNPVDLGAPAVNDPEIWIGAFRAMLADDRIGLVLATFGGGQQLIARRAADYAAQAGKPLIIYVYSRPSGAAGPTGFEELALSGIPVYTSDSEVVRAIAAFTRHASLRRLGVLPPLGPQLISLTSSVALGEVEARALLDGFGVQFPRSEMARDEAELLTAAAAVGYPLVLKVHDSRIVHKTDAGGVALGITDDASLLRAAADMRQALAANGFPDPWGFLVNEQVDHAHLEWLVGVDTDQQFGPAIAFGLGGVLVEALNDVAIEPVPLDRARAERLIARVASARHLAGGSFRGKRVDREALVELLLRVSDLAVAERGRLIELDINPVVSPSGGGAIALDARALVAI
jgi:acyl-CoA synthetase (NDP forming)